VSYDWRGLSQTEMPSRFAFKYETISDPVSGGYLVAIVLSCLGLRTSVAFILCCAILPDVQMGAQISANAVNVTRSQDRIPHIHHHLGTIFLKTPHESHKGPVQSLGLKTSKVVIIVHSLHIPFPCPFRKHARIYQQLYPQAPIWTPSAYMCLHSNLTKSGLLVLDGNVTAGSTLVLTTDEVRYLLILGLLDGGLVVLGSSAHELLLDEIDPWEALVRHR